MRADICEPTDEEAVARFKLALSTLNAESIGHAWAIGVDQWQYRIGENILNVFADSWSIDVEGSSEVIERVVAAMQSVRA